MHLTIAMQYVTGDVHLQWGGLFYLNKDAVSALAFLVSILVLVVSGKHD